LYVFHLKTARRGVAQVDAHDASHGCGTLRQRQCGAEEHGCNDVSYFHRGLYFITLLLQKYCFFVDGSLNWQRFFAISSKIANFAV
jgi:hypothetical protein